MTVIADMFADNRYLGEGGMIWVALRDCEMSQKACGWAVEAILQSVFRPRPRTDFWFPDLTFTKSSGAWNAVLGSGAHMVFQPLGDTRRRAGYSVLTRCVQRMVAEILPNGIRHTPFGTIPYEVRRAHLI